MQGRWREVKLTGVRLCITNHWTLLLVCKKVQLLKQYATVLYKKSGRTFWTRFILRATYVTYIFVLKCELIILFSLDKV